MSLFRPIAGVVTALLGYQFLTKDSWRYQRHEAGIAENEMVRADRFEHLYHSMNDVSPYTGMNHLKHRMFNPENYHFITRPMHHIKARAEWLYDNMIPIGLMGIGATYGLNLSAGSVLSRAWQGLSQAASLAGQSISVMGRGAVQVIRDIHLPRMPALGPREVVAAGALTGMLLYVANKFKRELTGENRDEAFNMLKPPH